MAKRPQWLTALRNEAGVDLVRLAILRFGQV